MTTVDECAVVAAPCSGGDLAAAVFAAWDAGEAIPWANRGDIGPPPEERGDAGTVEGTGREVSEQPLPENGQPDQPPEPPYGETQGQRRKKRKRRG